MFQVVAIRSGELEALDPYERNHQLDSPNELKSKIKSDQQQQQRDQEQRRLRQEEERKREREREKEREKEKEREQEREWKRVQERHRETQKIEKQLQREGEYLEKYRACPKCGCTVKKGDLTKHLKIHEKDGTSGQGNIKQVQQRWRYITMTTAT